MTPNLLARIFTVLALLVLTAGSTIISVAFVGGTFNPETPYDLGVGAGYAIALVWPFILCIAWLLGTIALLLQRHLAAATLLLLIVSGVYVLVQRILYLIAFMGGGAFPKRGLPAMLVIIVFLSLDAGAIYLSWRYVMWGGTDALILWVSQFFVKSGRSNWIG